ncbi:proteasome accessory factor PafA2 [Paenarthrobacter sp. Z7-10]|uniref:depupylase/deamidase Dop n=1 Tax=Paenarthrobacter sp. Z7-10 TaxID=2787635 RepID=UPI0022A9426A|nr:depupylase/deamidase Dop [Paenarthrobacter sp. Z7-10]MCZ2404177.1 proteasome accessory factor PafA2 [Paenarthrobacter sp. Z7-10]
MGSETEFGIHAPSDPGSNATWLSSQVVHAYAQLTGERAAGGSETRWDYTDEDPLADARGWTIPRHSAHPSQLTDRPQEQQDPAPELTAAQVALEGAALDLDDGSGGSALMMNMVLGNGARLYVDHAHPEYSSPEVTNPLDAVRWDAAGDAVALATVRQIARNPSMPGVNLYKNNTDNKSVSYGSHENYLMPRQVPFGRIVSGLTPFFVTRQLICGAGRVGLGQDGSGHGYQLSARADFFEAEVGLETTIRRPIINTRDEPHAIADKYRRLHVIIGDANLSQVSNYLKFGTTALVLDMIEHGTVPELSLHDPVAALQTVSHDLSMKVLLRVDDGRRMSALDIQELYLQAAQKHCQRSGAGDEESGDGHSAQVLRRWEEVLRQLADDPAGAAGQVEWVAKLSLLQQYRDRDSLAWNHPRLGLIDLQWSDVRPEKGLYYRLLSRGRMERMVADEAIARAVVQPPEDTRAYFRGQCIQRYGSSIAGASWDSVIFELPGDRRLQRVPTREPQRGTRALTQGLFDRHRDAAGFLAELLDFHP